MLFHLHIIIAERKKRLEGGEQTPARAFCDSHKSSQFLCIRIMC
jgi:hypothetical protein